MKSLKRNIAVASSLLFAVVLSGCASTPKFDCDDARKRIIETDEKIKKAAADFHAADAQKDAGYYGVKTARTITCVSSLGLLCGLADKIASDNKKTEDEAEEYKENYEKYVKLTEGLRKSMDKNDCPDIPKR